MFIIIAENIKFNLSFVFISPYNGYDGYTQTSIQ